MTEKTIQLNLTEEQFNMIWNALVLSEDEMVDEGDIRVRVWWVSGCHYSASLVRVCRSIPRTDKLILALGELA